LLANRTNHSAVKFDAPIFQPSANELSRSPLPDCGTLCPRTSRRAINDCLWETTEELSLHCSFLQSPRSDFVISDTVIALCTYLLTYLPQILRNCDLVLS